MNSLPKSRSIIGYEDFFPDAPLANRMDLIRQISKSDLIAEISGMNYRLKPNDKKHTDYSLAGQDRELYYFCGGNQSLYRKYGRLARQFARGPEDHPLLFTRQTCLFALEEIIQSDIPNVENFSMRNSWEPLLQYLLAVNSEVARIRNDKREQTTEDGDSDITPDLQAAALTFEDINARIIVLNELNIGSDQLYLPYRSLQFLKFLTEHESLGPLATEYLQEKYDMDYQRFVFEITSMYLANNADKQNNVKNAEIGFELDTTFIYYPTPQNIRLFQDLSQHYPSNDPEKLLSIRKYPFYNNTDKSFYLMDNTFCLEKAYSQFINDFWFDKVKPILNENGRPKFDIRYYRAAIGQFFEGYIAQSFSFMMAQARHVKLRQFDELFVMENGNRVEFTDVYVRYADRIFIAEAKSTGIYDKEKYSTELNEFYRGGRDTFFDAFGVNQIANAVQKIKTLAIQFDPGFPQRGTIKVYPAVIVNEKALQTPLMAQVFNNRFQELLRENQVDLQQIRLAPLAIIHLSDLENMEESVKEDLNVFWRILDRHALNTQFVPPFFHTMNTLQVKPIYERPRKVIFELINAFNPENTD